MPHDIWSAGGSLEAMLESGGAAGARHPYVLRGGAVTRRRRMPPKGHIRHIWRQTMGWLRAAKTTGW